jgi:hypothetical protein
VEIGSPLWPKSRQTPPERTPYIRSAQRANALRALNSELSIVAIIAMRQRIGRDASGEWLVNAW